MTLLHRAFHALPSSLRREAKRAILSAGAACRVVPHGAHLIFDIKRRLPNERVSLIFDVGANVGQSVGEFRGEFPGARIFSFEPDPETFAQLKTFVAGMKNVEIFNCGLGRESGTLRFDNTWPATQIRRVAQNQDNQSLPLINVTTVDEFCADHGIAGIDYLKIDTEGHDLEVLKGATRTFEREAANIVVAECSMSALNRTHVSFFEIQRHMESFGYRLFGIFHQNMANERKGNPNITWSNCVYISAAVAGRN